MIQSKGKRNSRNIRYPLLHLCQRMSKLVFVLFSMQLVISKMNLSLKELNGCIMVIPPKMAQTPFVYHNKLPICCLRPF